MSPIKSGAATAFAIGMLGFAASALAASKPVTAGNPVSSGSPAVAVTGSGSAVIAWANQQDVTRNYVQYCVVLVGGKGCQYTGNLIPADSAAGVDGVQVLNDGSTIVILADVFGAAGDSAVARQYEPEQEWQSTDGGATWDQVDGGLSVANGVLNADTGPVSAVILPGTGVLGYGWDTPGTGPTFNAFPLSSPPQCSRASCGAGFARLEPASNPDQLGNEPGQFASQLGSQPGVLGVFDSLFNSGPLGCPTSFGTAYVYASGLQSATNNYNVSPGLANSAWRVPISQADCNAEHPAAGGGPSGFGLLEQSDANSTTVYHRFDQATARFDTPTVRVAKQGELYPSLSQNGSGGIYATYLLGGSGGPVTLSYSADGGNVWSGATINPNKDGGAAYLSSFVNPAGQGWAAWLDNGAVIAQSFAAVDAIKPAFLKASAQSNSKTVTLEGGCSVVPCSLTVRLSPLKHPKKTVARGTFKLTKGGYQKLVLHLKGVGKAFFSGSHRRVKVTATLTERVGTVAVGSHRTVTVKIVKSKKK